MFCLTCTLTLRTICHNKNICGVETDLNDFLSICVFRMSVKVRSNFVCSGKLESYFLEVSSLGESGQHYLPNTFVYYFCVIRYGQLRHVATGAKTIYDVGLATLASLARPLVFISWPFIRI